MNKDEFQVILIASQADWMANAATVLENEGYNVAKARKCDKIEGFVNTRLKTLVLVDHSEICRDTRDLKRILKSCRAQNCRVVILCTGGPDLPTLRKMFKLKVFDCATKPYDQKNLVELVKREIV